MKVLVFVLISFWCAYADQVPVAFYIMSKCPYARALVGQFNTNVMKASGLHQITNITFNYIANADTSQPTGFYSKHGQDEVRGDWYELCVEESDPDKLFDFVYCNDYDFGGFENIPKDVQNCAKQTDIAWDSLSSCYTQKGPALLTASIKKTNAVGATYSPTLLIGGKCVYGAMTGCNNLDPTTDAMKQLICVWCMCLPLTLPSDIPRAWHGRGDTAIHVAEGDVGTSKQTARSGSLHQQKVTEPNTATIFIWEG